MRSPLARALALAALAGFGLCAAASRAEDASAAPQEPLALTALREAGTARDEGRYGDAAIRLATIEDPELAAHVGLLRARLLRADGNVDGALAIARAALPSAKPRELRVLLWIEIAALERERGDAAAFQAAQREAWEATTEPARAAALKLESARALADASQKDEAQARFAEIWRAAPLAPAAAEAQSRDEALRVELALAPVPPEALLTRANALRGAFRCEEALPIFERVLAAAPESPGAARARADCLFSNRRYPEAEQAYRALSKASPTDPELVIQLARSLARGGQVTAATSLLERLAASPDLATRARARALLAVLVEDSEPARAVALWRKVEKQTAAPELVTNARWTLAWSDLRGARHAQALPRLAKLAAGDPSDIEVQRALYWRAIALTVADSTRDDGEAALRALHQQVPYSYYGWLAEQRLGVAAPAERNFAGARDDRAEPASFRLARWLATTGWSEVALAELANALEEAPLRREDRLRAARTLHAAGEHNRAVQLVVDGFGSTLDQGIDPAWRDAWELAWPKPWDDVVSRATSEFASDPALVYAVMREESVYQPGVASPAGALGLMQLIPPTAGRIAGELGLPTFRSEELYEPATNIRFGAYYLRQLAQRFGGSRALAIASYNAGPEAVQRWRTRDGELEPDAFVESVPYGETRRYLRRVLRSHRMYGRLYGLRVEAPAVTPAVAAQPGQVEIR